MRTLMMAVLVVIGVIAIAGLAYAGAGPKEDSFDLTLNSNAELAITVPADQEITLAAPNTSGEVDANKASALVVTLEGNDFEQASGDMIMEMYATADTRNTDANTFYKLQFASASVTAVTDGDLTAGDVSGAASGDIGYAAGTAIDLVNAAAALTDPDGCHSGKIEYTFDLQVYKNKKVPVDTYSHTLTIVGTDLPA